MDDKQILKQIQAGDRFAFAELVETYQTKVIHLSYSLLSDYEDACDAAQEVFVKVFRAADTFRGDSSLQTWIYRITRNVCNDFLRKRKEKKVVSIDEEKDDSPKYDLPDTSNSPEELAERNETQRLVRKALLSLDADSRMIITMFDIEGLSYEEMAQVLKIPIGTVKSRLNRAREKLKKFLLKNSEHF